MREIREVIFRGKRTDNGEWIEGSLLGIDWCDKPSTYSIAPNTPVSVFYSVIPETVGQYTGLTDKNGKRIFEGDILHCVSKLDNAKMVVIFECGEYRMVLAEKFKDYIGNCGFYAITCFEKEVIGNIHDNPEILKGGGENG